MSELVITNDHEHSLLLTGNPSHSLFPLFALFPGEYLRSPES